MNRHHTGAYAGPACSIDTREKNIAALGEGVLDVLVTGGGINGAGVLRDLALRNLHANAGLRLGLVEKNHFGSGTSGKNSHLIHGGLRYLKFFDFRLVREALEERATLLRIAPHLVRPLRFLMPFESRAAQAFYQAGLWVYDALAGKYSLERPRLISRTEMESIEPNIRPGAFAAYGSFSDCQVESARLVLENVFEAIRNGAFAANHVELLDRERVADHWRIRLRDRVSGSEFSARTKRIVDASGAWTKSGEVRLVRGSHLILPRLGSSGHAVAYFEPSGRIVFFIPWGTDRQYTLVGTTEVDHTGSPDDVRISPEETAYLLDIARRVYREEAIGTPLSSFSSLRPLVREEGRRATDTSRGHRIWVDAEGVVRITGGKYTTYRRMSEEAADLAWPGLNHLHLTADTPIEGNSLAALESLARRSPELSRWLPVYGVAAEAFAGYVQEFAEAAAIVYAARHEMAVTLDDVLYISTTWGYEQNLDEATRAVYQNVFDQAIRRPT